MNVVVNSLMTNYQKVGEGKKTLVFLPGWGDNSQSFSELIENLPADYTSLILDLPGFGGSQAASEVWNLDNYSNFIKAWLQKIQVKDVYAVVGHSNGGGIAIRAVALGLLKPGKLVLISSAGVRDRHKLKKSLLKAVSKSGKVITAPLPQNVKKGIRRKLYSGLGSDAGLFPQMEGTFRKIISQDVQQDAKLVKIPTLLIYGAQDKSTPTLFGRIFHDQIKSSRLEIIEGAGHYVQQEQAERVAELIEEFLK